MDTAELVDPKRREGELLLRELDNDRFPATAVFWYRLPESGDWRLIIASPTVGDRGPDFAYQQIQRALSRLPADRHIRLTDIWVVKETEPLVSIIRSARHTGPAEITSHRFYNTTASGVYIDRAYIYRST